MILKQTPEDFIVREIADLQLRPGQYSTYLLRKRQWNTEDVLQWLARSLKIPRKDIGVCGMKDRQALTEQYITIRRGPKYPIVPRDCTLTYLGTRAEPLRLGAHRRNSFIITARSVQRPVPSSATRCKNFYGGQRFSTANSAIGLAILRREYARACELLGLPLDNPVQQLRTLPRQTLHLSVHAAQSDIWNDMVRRTDGYDTLPLPGFAPPGSPEELAIMDAALVRAGLSREHFINRSFPEVSLEGSARAVYQDLQDFSVSEEHDGALVVCFSLPPGQYATVAVSAMLGVETTP